MDMDTFVQSAPELTSLSHPPTRSGPPIPIQGTITCMACIVSLTGPEQRRQHYSSDFHRVNLKRKVAGIAPISQEQFQQRLQALQQEFINSNGVAGPGMRAGTTTDPGSGARAGARAGAAVNRTSSITGGRVDRDDGDASVGSYANLSKAEKKAAKAQICEICHKRFSTWNAFQQHVLSKRHLDKVKQLENNSDTVCLHSDDNTSVMSMQSLPSSSHDQVDHMTGVLLHNVDPHTIREQILQERLKNASKIPVHVCVFDGHDSISLEDNVNYMAAKFSFFIPYLENLVDLQALIEYLGEKVGLGYACVACSKSFANLDAARDHMISKSHTRMVDDDNLWMDEYAEFYDFSLPEGDDDNPQQPDQDGWHEVTDQQEKAELMDIVSTNSSIPRTRFEKDDDELQVDKFTEEQVLELTLPSGTKIGHRSLQRYYKQSYRPAETRQSVLLNQIESRYRLLGYGSSSKALILTPAQAKDREIAWRQRKDQHHYHAKMYLHVGMSNYHTRKSKLNPSMGVLNSGYRP